MTAPPTAAWERSNTLWLVEAPSGVSTLRMFTVFDAVDFLPKQIMGFLRVAPPWIAPGDPPVVLPSDGHFPSWMPDGRIIFVSGRRDGSSQIWLMNAADGSGAIQLGNLSPSMNPKLPQGVNVIDLLQGKSDMSAAWPENPKMPDMVREFLDRDRGQRRNGG